MAQADETEFTVLTAVKRVREEPLAVSLHVHQCYELVYYVLDEGETVIEGHAYPLGAAVFALLPPGTRHAETHRGFSSLLFVQFTSPVPLPLTVGVDSSGQLYPVLKAVLRELLEQLEGYRLMLSAKLRELVALLRRWQPNPRRHMHKDFQFVIQYLDENYHEKIVFSELAQQFHYGYDYFHHYFKQVTGQSPRAYLLERRLQGACRMLENPAVSCTEVAYRCGFSTAPQFSAAFRRRFGIAPTEYRKSHCV